MNAISALNQLFYCAHRCFLMHRCGEMEANHHVWQGRRLHRRADRPGHSVRAGTTVYRARSVESTSLGIMGVLDVLEQWSGGGCVVEYKHGHAPTVGVWPNDAVQVCAQVLCLEEEGMINLKADIYYEGSGCRREVVLSSELREQTREACRRLSNVINGTERTLPILGPHCEGCSVKGICLPQAQKRHNYWEKT